MTTKHSYNPPPGWPPMPEGWTPPPGWEKPADWPDAPEGWQLWQPVPTGPQWYTKRWVQLVACGAVAFVVGGIAGGAGASSANDRAFTAEQSAKKAKADLKEAQADSARWKGEAATAAKNATAAVAAREAAVAKREKAAGVAETTARANTFAGDGTFLVGTDVQPGTYRASAQPGCYWSRLKSLDTFDIIDNGNPDGPVVIQVARTDKAVQVAGCGEFHKVG